jgi:hypothetical protein
MNILENIENLLVEKWKSYYDKAFLGEQFTIKYNNDM